MKIAALILLYAVCVFASCQDRSAQNVNIATTAFPSMTPEPEPTKPPIPEALLKASPEELCASLKDIKTLPTFEPTPTDPIYEAIILKGEAAIPCLVAQVGNTKIVKDPRYSVPTWHSFAVGDTALFTLLDILSKDDGKEWERRLLESLPIKSRKEWEINGIYAYFNYVLEPKNRTKLQRWWKNWLSKNKK